MSLSIVQPVESDSGREKGGNSTEREPANSLEVQAVDEAAFEVRLCGECEMGCWKPARWLISL